MVRVFLATAVAFALGAAGVYVLVAFGVFVPPDAPNPGRPSTSVDDAAADASRCPHGLTPDQCPFCKPELIEQLGECVGHGVPEALCWKCHAELIAAFKDKKDWCPEHDCPESLCTICRGDAHGASAGAASASTTPTGPRTGRPPSETCTNDQTRVELASADLAGRAGLEYVEVQSRPVTDWLTCQAEVAFDANRYAQISSRVAGVVREVRVDLGAKVAKGDVLALIDSTELAAAKADYLQSAASVGLLEKTHERQAGLLSQGVSASREVQESAGKLAEARIAQSRSAQRLRILGLSEGEIADLPASGDTTPLLPLTAPFEGELVDRFAVIGQTIETTTTLFTLADTRCMWAMLNLPDLSTGARTGQTVLLTPDGLAEREFEGRVTWMSTRIDPRKRMLLARAEFDNPEGLLKANMFGRARIRVRDGQQALLVPKAAVQWDGCCNVVFVRNSDTSFEPRKVRLGPAFEGSFEVKEGLAGGESVVTQGSFLLKTEILKGEIGAGCCPTDMARK